MREHLYRGQRLDNREWLYGLPSQTHDGGMDIRTKEEFEGFEYFVPREINPLTLGEFTSELDRTGRRIFEDDICIDALGDKWVIIFKKAAFRAKSLEKGVYWNLDGSKLTVVGNMHDVNKTWL